MDLAEHVAKNKRDIDMGTDTVLVQIIMDGKWTDYCRVWYMSAATTVERAFNDDKHRTGRTTKWRMVDWITKDELTFI
jgi:hypothetical protein